MPGANEPHAGDLKRDLRGWQIFFIVASIILGEGIFSGDAQALELAGPGGALLALFLVGILVICVMESVSELVQLFPVPNAIAEYIEAFVDKDLAWCCGVAYWYTWASVFAALNLQLGQYTKYWNLDQTFLNIILALAPIGMVCINLLGVNTFGIVESVGGFLKICMVFGTGIAMYHLHSQAPQGDIIDDGIRADAGLVASPGTAVCYSVLLILYSFLGVESVTVTAFEARDVRSLRGPSRWIAWFVFTLYGFTFISELLVCSWQSKAMPQIYGNTNDTQKLDAKNVTPAMPVYAAYTAGMPKLAGFINGCLIFCMLSASNSALYVASRTLYGLARNSEAKKHPISRTFKRFENTTPNTHVPALAIVFSAATFFWLPFLDNINDQSAPSIILQFLFDSACSMCLIVWAALCLSFLRFRWWMMLCSDHMHEYSRYNRHYSKDYADRLPNVEKYIASTFLMSLQPGLAWIGLIGSLVVVAILNTTPWWRGPVSVDGQAVFGGEFAIAWSAPLAFLLLLGLRKLWARWMHPSYTQPRWVHISSDPGPLIRTLVELDCAVPLEEVRLRDRLGERMRARYPFLAQLDCFRPRNSLINERSSSQISVEMQARASDSTPPSAYAARANDNVPDEPDERIEAHAQRRRRSVAEESEVSAISDIYRRQ